MHIDDVAAGYSNTGIIWQYHSANHFFAAGSMLTVDDAKGYFDLQTCDE
jgi:hypothetical protein